ncbi:helix-turn-helix domain-containing protein [Marinitenerispora sediminis]|uniref:Transcriptional regulator n=1 Tax=Marinitenerispora sediminis TaxID=1931232 RepID=A0A368TBS8_9ACTN|nr:helix-turn-helix transcriptional regulator [Marinitenerispora sediminis]RCV56662.1 transcriptional regulator [Marinitenerispora sediminis]RCV61654.1 transcriptional regulator [Marinitenerispora sediminis]RCV62614.1 transcriptional regulator [Marinitenerispora sediminis]
MSTDFQQGRRNLGARLRELRTEAGLTGKQLAARLGWQPSKVSRLENGRQTATVADLEAWANALEATGVLSELKGRLRGLETAYRSWKRHLAAGHRAVQEASALREAQTKTIHVFESGIIPGLFQTPEYARGVLADVSDRIGSPRDIEAGVRARMQRQEVLYRPGRHFHALIWEGALHVARCAPEAMAAQLDRLCGVIGLDTVTLGVIPFGVRTHFSPKHGFWIMDERLVVVETWNAELWLDSTDDVALYRRIWNLMAASAIYEHKAHRLITRARDQFTRP